MAVSVTLESPDGDDEPVEIASSAAWAEFLEWVEALPSAGFGKVKGIADGVLKDTFVFAAQLRTALDMYAPSESVSVIAEELLEYIGIGDELETLSTVE